MGHIEIENLTYQYPGAKGPALLEVSATIPAGGFVAIVGANNSGKSTLCYSLAGVVPHLYHGKMRGRIIVDGTDNQAKTVSEIAMRVGLVLQTPDSQMSGIRFSVFEEVAFGLENRGVAREEIRHRVKKVLQLLGLEKVATQSPFHLSGGQQQRLALATVLAVDPAVLVLDEPTTFLDPPGAKLVFDILRQLQQQGKTIIIAEQRLDLIGEYAERVLALDQGSLAMDATPREVLSSPTIRALNLEWTRYTQVADRACRKGVLPARPTLPVTLSETVGFIGDCRKDHARPR